MTQNPHSYSNWIDRRTALALLGGGLTALAGCSNSSSSGSSASLSNGDSVGGQSNTEGWVPPEEQSEYITDSSFVADNLQLLLELQLQNSADIVNFELLDARGNDYDSQYPDGGMVNLILANGANNELSEDPPETEVISSGENTLEITFSAESDKDDTRIPLQFGTSVEFQQVTLGESVEGVDNDDALAIALKNTGPHATVPGLTQYANTPHENSSGQTLSSDFSVIEPGETGVAVVPSDIWRPNRCSEYTERTLEFTCSLFWASSLTVSQPVEYSGTGFICGSLNGPATVNSTNSTDSSDS